MSASAGRTGRRCLSAQAEPCGAFPPPHPAGSATSANDLSVPSRNRRAGGRYLRIQRFCPLPLPASHERIVVSIAVLKQRSDSPPLVPLERKLSSYKVS